MDVLLPKIKLKIRLHKELKNKKFNDVLDCGCGTGPMIEILCEKYPDKLYTGLDLTPEMIYK